MLRKFVAIVVNFYTNKKNELNELLNEIRNTMSDTDAEIRQTTIFLKNIRQKLFHEIEKEISDL